MFSPTRLPRTSTMRTLGPAFASVPADTRSHPVPADTRHPIPCLSLLLATGIRPVIPCGSNQVLPTQCRVVARKRELGKIIVNSVLQGRNFPNAHHRATPSKTSREAGPRINRKSGIRVFYPFTGGMLDRSRSPGSFPMFSKTHKPTVPKPTPQFQQQV